MCCAIDANQWIINDIGFLLRIAMVWLKSSVIFVNENENENYQKRKNNDSVNEN